MALSRWPSDNAFIRDTTVLDSVDGLNTNMHLLSAVGGYQTFMLGVFVPLFSERVLRAHELDPCNSVGTVMVACDATES